MAIQIRTLSSVSTDTFESVEMQSIRQPPLGVLCACGGGPRGIPEMIEMPKSTLLMLVSALMGRERMRAVYDHAVAEGYRFFSYGDASLLLPHEV